jgi:hypothetical protein
MLLTGEDRRTRWKGFSSATLSTTSYTWTDPGANPGLCGERLPENRLNLNVSTVTRFKETATTWIVRSFFCLLKPLLFRSVYTKQVCVVSCEKEDNIKVRFHVLTAASMKLTAFWNIAACTLVEVWRHFAGAYCLHHHVRLCLSTIRLHGTIHQKAVCHL